MKSAKSLSKTFFNLRKPDIRSPKLHRYVWIDLEMTGLDVKKDTILEIACVITTTDLEVVDKELNLVIHQDENVLKSMGSWALNQHAKTGLIMESRESKITLEQADKQIYDYTLKNSDPNGCRYLAGNSVYMDKMFIDKYLHLFSSLLSYKLLDVTTIKILCSHWFQDEFSKLPEKKNCHRALSDIFESLNELKEYQKAIFKS